MDDIGSQYTFSKPVHKSASLYICTQNIYTILRDISEKFGIEFDSNSDGRELIDNSKTKIWSRIADENRPETQQLLAKQLESQFPFFRIMPRDGDFENEEPYAILKELIKQVSEYRNYFTHHLHKEIRIESKLKEVVLEIFSQAIARVEFIKDDIGPNDVAHLKIQGNQPNGHYKLLNDKELSEKGLLFLICLFLEKKDAIRLLKQFPGFKNDSSPIYKATLEVFTYFCSKLPKPRLRSDEPKQGLALDMVNELYRCPKEILDVIGSKDKKHLEIPVEYREGFEGDESTVIMTRNGNRFYELAMRYLDNEFSELRFQVDLGTYCYKTAQYKIEGTERERRWIKRVLAFGKLKDFDPEKAPKQWKNKRREVKDGESPQGVYVNNTAPHYNIENNNIGLKWTGPENSTWPKLKDFDSEAPIETLQRNEAPDIWLSVYELPALALYHILYKKRRSYNRHTKANKDLPKEVGSVFEKRQRRQSQLGEPR